LFGWWQRRKGSSAAAGGSQGENATQVNCQLLALHSTSLGCGLRATLTWTAVSLQYCRVFRQQLCCVQSSILTLQLMHCLLHCLLLLCSVLVALQVVSPAYSSLCGSPAAQCRRYEAGSLGSSS
jgi:hypothetical protein